MTDLPQFESALWHIVGQHRDSGTNDAAIAESLRRMARRLSAEQRQETPLTVKAGDWTQVGVHEVTRAGKRWRKVDT